MSDNQRNGRFGHNYHNNHRNYYNNRYQTKRHFNNRFTDTYSEAKDMNGSIGDVRQHSEAMKSSQMPGIPVHRNESIKTAPFVNSDPKTNAVTNESNDKTIGKQDLEKLTESVAKIDLKEDIVCQKNGLTTDLEPKTEAIEDKPQDKNSTGNVIPTPVRRNTIGTDGRYQRYPRPRIGNQTNGPNHSYLNSHKFYPSADRLNANKYQMNEQNKRSFKQKTFSPPKPQMNGSNANDFQTIPPMFMSGDVCNPYYAMQPPFMELPVNYPIPIGGYDMTSKAPISGHSNEEKHQKMVDKKVNPPMETPHFIPFEPTKEFPNPPEYWGHIQIYAIENGFMHLFVCDYPPNITPLPLQVMANGLPILPSNCKLFF